MRIFFDGQSRWIDQRSHWQLFLIILIFDEVIAGLAWLVFRSATRLSVLQMPSFIIGLSAIVALAAIAQFLVIYIARRYRTQR